MKPAISSQRRFERAKVLYVNESPNTIQSLRLCHTTVRGLPDLFGRGDLLVINRSGTLPSSYRGRIARTGEFAEIRLASFLGDQVKDLSQWKAVVFGEGTWRQATEDRGAAPSLRTADVIELGEDLQAVVLTVDQEHERLITIRFRSKNLVSQLYTQGRPIQYSYLKESLKVWDQQTLFSGPPISTEPPSAGFQLNWSMMEELQKRGVEIVTVLHGAGLSSTGNPSLDERLPLDEYFEMDSLSLHRIEAARKRKANIIALGTSAARALESAYEDPNHVVRNGRTVLRLSRSRPARILNGLITGMHEEGTSHLRLLESLSLNAPVLKEIIQNESRDYLSHEFGDLTFVKREIC